MKKMRQNLLRNDFFELHVLVVVREWGLLQDFKSLSSNFVLNIVLKLGRNLAEPVNEFGNHSLLELFDLILLI